MSLPDRPGDQARFSKNLVPYLTAIANDNVVVKPAGITFLEARNLLPMSNVKAKLIPKIKSGFLWCWYRCAPNAIKPPETVPATKDGTLDAFKNLKSQIASRAV